MIKRLMAIIMACISLLYVQAGQAAAEEPLPENQSIYVTPFTQTGGALTGIAPSKQEIFQILPYWNVDEAKLNLDYQITQISNQQISSITLSVNGNKFYSFRPSLSEVKQRVTVDIPKESLSAGSNTIRIEGYVQTSAMEQACSEDTAPDQWLQIFDTSSIDIRYTRQALTGTISDFYQHFVGMDTIKAGKSMITVPENSGSGELEAAVYALSGLAKANTLTDATIPLMPYSSEQVKDKEAVVMVGLYDHLPAELSSLVNAESLDSQALIQLVNLEAKPVLIVTSKDPKLLAQATRFVANPDLMRQISSAAKAIDSTTDVYTPAAEINRNVTLTEAGDKLAGPHHREMTYFVSLPANRSIADASKISLDYRYAQNLDFDRSMVTVLINNTPIGSKKLIKELSDGDRVTFPVPKNMDISGSFSVTVAFDLEMINAACTPNEEQMPWAYITKNTVLQVNTKDNTDLLLNSYPYPFLRDGLYNHAAVVMPKERDTHTYQTLSNLFNLLGRYAAGNTGDVTFYDDQASAEDLKDHNIIAIGSYQNNAVIRQVNDKLYFQYDQSGAGFRSNEKMSIDSEYGKRLGTLQLIPSPFGTGNGLLAVTGAGSEYVELASELLASEKARWKVYGDGVAADKDGNVYAHRFKLITGGEQDTVIEDLLQRTDVLGFTAAVILVLCFIIVSLFLLVRKHTKKRRGRR